MNALLGRVLREERGQAIVLLGTAMVVLLGIAALVLDVGVVYQSRRASQNAADAAALAAASRLPASTGVIQAEALALAYEYGELNEADLAGLSAEILTSSHPNDTIRVTIEHEVPMRFGRVLGVESAPVRVTAVTQVGNVSGRRNVLPLGVEEPVAGFLFGEEYCLKLGSQSGGCSGSDQGNFWALDIDDNGNASGEIYRNSLVSGSALIVRVGDVKEIVQGNMAGPTSQGVGCSGNGGRIEGNNQEFSDVIQANADATYTVIDWESPRLGLVPIVEFPTPQTARILGFGVFFINDCGPNGSMTGFFVDTVVVGGEWAPLDPDADWGAHAARLVQ